MSTLSAHVGGTAATTCSAPGGSAPPATSPTSSIATASIDRRWSPVGRTVTTSTGTAIPSRRTWSGSRRCGACYGPIGMPSPAERLEPALERLRAAPQLVDLPPRISLFGLTRLAPSVLRVLDAIGQARDVHLLLLHPSPALWSRVDSDQATTADCAEPAAEDVGQGRPRASARHRGRASPATARSTMPARGSADTLLAQAARRRAGGRQTARPSVRRSGRRPSGHLPPTTTACRSTPATAAPARSRCFATRSSTCFADDPTLEPRDVIVMCPDIETFAPLIHATFGAGDDSRRREQRQPACPACASGSPTAPLRQTNPLLGALADAARARRRPGDRLAGRSTSPAREPVRRRFRFDDDELDPHRATGCADDRRSAGASTPRTGRRSSSTASSEHLAGRARPRAARRRDGRGRQRSSAACCRSTTSTAATSTWPGGSPSWSTGSQTPLDRARPAAADHRLGDGDRRRRRRAARPTAPRDAWQRARARPAADEVVAEAGGAAVDRRSRCRSCARCSPIGCAAGRPGPTSAPAT